MGSNGPERLRELVQCEVRATARDALRPLRCRYCPSAAINERLRLEGKVVLFRYRNLFLVGLTGAAIAIGCTVNVDDDRDRDRDRDGTVNVDSSRASALVLGRIDASVN